MPDTKVTIGGIVALAVGIGIVVLIATSLKKLNSDQVGLFYNTIQKTLGKDPVYEGLHNGPPGFEFIIFPSVFRTLNFDSLQCLNKDGVEINLDISYQYRVKADHLYTIVMEFEDHKLFTDVLRSIGESALHDACSKFNTSQFQAERGAFQEELRERLVNKYNGVYTDITDLQVNDIRRPGLYEQAVKNKESAREDIEVAKQERPRKLTEAETAKLEAETQANIQIDKAKSDARIKETAATAEAEAILNDYYKEAETYKELISATGLNLNTEGLLAYMGVRVVDEAKHPVYIGMKAPAKVSWTKP